MPLYENYARIRDQNSLTDYRIWKETGIATATLSDWKNGKSNPKIDKLKILSDYFGVPVEYFLSEEV